jgi:hypothetical protein
LQIYSPGQPKSTRLLQGPDIWAGSNRQADHIKFLTSPGSGYFFMEAKEILYGPSKFPTLFLGAERLLTSIACAVAARA